MAPAGSQPAAPNHKSQASTVSGDCHTLQPGASVYDDGGPTSREISPPWTTTNAETARRRHRPFFATRTARRLGSTVCALVVTDLGGGLLAVASGVNTWAEAWGSKALLAAPVPMIAAQVVLTAVAARKNGRGAAVAAGLLGVACFVSVISGFFDGGIGNDELTPALSAYQMFLLALTALVGALAAIRAREAWVR